MQLSLLRIMEYLLSAGIDIGTTTTHLVISRIGITVERGWGTVPKAEIKEKTILYQSPIYFTPLADGQIDLPRVQTLIDGELEKAGTTPRALNTGAVILTGESVKKRNARRVAGTVADGMGDFVVASAGPRLESILAARGAGADALSAARHCKVLHADIGGGTANLAFFDNGVLQDTACLEIGGRHWRADKGVMTPTLRALLTYAHLAEDDHPAICAAYARLLEMGMNLRPKDDFFSTILTDKTLNESLVPDILSFSGGVSACMGQDLPPYAYGDLGVLLARAITKSPAIAAKEMVLAENGIRATVIGAGNYSLALSGTTIAAPSQLLPVKNVPVIEVQLQTAADIPTVGEQIAAGLRTFDLTDSQPVAVAFAGYAAPSFRDLMALAEQIATPLGKRGGLFVTVSQADIAKALGGCLRHLLPQSKFLCMDRIACGSGDYIDIGHPVAEATALPVIVKQLIFS